MNIKDITLSQLQEKPIWKFEIQANGEIIIEETNRSEIRESASNPPEGYIVYSEFLAADGKKYQGFCSPEDPCSLDYVQPVIIYEGKYLEFCPDKFLTDSEQKTFLAALDTTAKDFFPVTCLPGAKVDNISVKIIILDFERMNTNYWDILKNANST